MPVIADLIRSMAAAGAPPEAIAIAVEAIEAHVGQRLQGIEASATRSSGAERQARYRARRGMTEPTWEALRLHVLKRDRFVCSYCGAPDADRCVHITPPARGGLSEQGNLVAACVSCERSRPGSERRT